jgi:Phosphatidylinositol-4-phosphate 5-Kinase
MSQGRQSQEAQRGKKSKHSISHINYYMQFLKFKREDQKSLAKIIEADTKFLRDRGLMDYSLLLAVEKNIQSVRNKLSEASRLKLTVSGSMFDTKISTYSSSDDKKFSNLVISNNFASSFGKKKSSLKMKEYEEIQKEPTFYKYLSESDDFIYHLSIIDYLQKYNQSK